MRLLLDENLSPRLLTLLDDLWPGSAHVRDGGLAERIGEFVRDPESALLVVPGFRPGVP